MGAWLVSLFERPIEEGERRRALALVIALLLAVVVGLTLMRPHAHLAPGQSHLPRPSAAHSPRSGATPVRGTTVDETRLDHVADRFLTGYLAFVYGRAPASAISDAEPALRRSLRARELAIPPAMRGRTARVLAVRPVPAPAGLFGVSAQINDGELASYTLELLLRLHGARLLVAAVEEG